MCPGLDSQTKRSALICKRVRITHRQCNSYIVLNNILLQSAGKVGTAGLMQGTPLPIDRTEDGKLLSDAEWASYELEGYRYCQAVFSDIKNAILTTVSPGRRGWRPVCHTARDCNTLNFSPYHNKDFEFDMTVHEVRARVACRAKR